MSGLQVFREEESSKGSLATESEQIVTKRWPTKTQASEKVTQIEAEWPFPNLFRHPDGDSQATIRHKNISTPPPPYIYIYIYICVCVVKLLAGPSLGVSGVIIWSK